MKTSTPRSFRFASLLSAALLALTASAQTSLKHADKSFIKHAAKAGMEEVDISRVAAARTMNPQVRTFAQMVVDDHTAANAALATIALSKGVTLPAQDMADADKWAKKGGKDFDEDYIEKMLSAHKDAVKLFAKEADTGEDAETKAFARATLPKLQHHLEMAMDLRKTVN